MIYITGDTHIPVDIQKLSSKRFPQQKDMTKNDYVIIISVKYIGVWRSPVARLLWEQDAAGSNPVISTIKRPIIGPILIERLFTTP